MTATYEHGYHMGWKELGGQCLVLHPAERKSAKPINSLHLSQQRLASQSAFTDAAFVRAQ